MKKKKWLIPLIIVALFVITFVAGVGTLLSKGYGASTGVYLESNDGVAMLICDKAPIILSSKHNGDMFTDLDVGDKFLLFMMVLKKAIQPEHVLMLFLSSVMAMQVMFLRQ